MKTSSKVANAPAKPLMLYDGECQFCKFWIRRWQHATAGQVDYLEAQNERVPVQFPELSREQFERSVQFIETDGHVYDEAEAVFRALAHVSSQQWPLWLYQNVPGAASAAEAGYRFVAGHRTAFGRLTRLLWGSSTVVPEHRLVSSAFLRLLGVIYLCAFVSLGTQIGGLLGSDGILPAHRFMTSARMQLDQGGIGVARYWMLPTLCWFGSSDASLKGLCVTGTVLALLVIAGLAPAPCLFLLWLIYLSLTAVGQEFLSFQWDVLLLETGFLAIFLAPLGWRLKWPARQGPSRIGLWLLRWLLFRLMLESGLVKLLSGDPTWRNLTALTFHFETQPLPTWPGWHAAQLSTPVLEVALVLMFGIELGAPFLILLPRLRLTGCALLVLLQVLILLTGNYGFFNWLTLALCLLLLDDAWLRKIFSGRRTSKAQAAAPAPASFPPSTSGAVAPTPAEIPVPNGAGPGRSCGWPFWLTAPLALVILLVTLTQVLEMVHVWHSPPAPLLALQRWVAPFASVNTYGLFAVMTISRPEIVVEGSNDGKTWLPYSFKYKPGDLRRRPAFVAPHQPRLDWQMWFAALGTSRQNPWFISFCLRLLQGKPEVLGLLEHNPFPNAPPRQIRAVVYDYRFTDSAEHRREGTWWRRKYAGEYLPAISLEDVR